MKRIANLSPITALICLMFCFVTTSGQTSETVQMEQFRHRLYSIPNPATLVAGVGLEIPGATFLPNVLRCTVPGRRVHAGRVVSGYVTHASGEALVCANVWLKGTDKGTTTGIDGRFEIEVPVFGCELEISYVGYRQFIIELPATKSDTAINVCMKPGITLGPCVVIACVFETDCRLEGCVLHATLAAEDIIENVLASESATASEELVATVYPNPFWDQLCVTVPQSSGETYILRLISANGSVLWSDIRTLMPGEDRVHLHPAVDLPDGVYMLTVRGEELSQTIPVMHAGR